jgi:hypothetical protein
LRGPQVRRALQAQTQDLAMANENLRRISDNPASTMEEGVAAMEILMERVQEFLAKFE